METSKPFRGTWLGRPGEVVEYARSKNALRTCGERVIVHQWLDTGDLQVRHVKGDGRRADFVTYDTLEIPPNMARHFDAEKYVTERLAS